MLLQSNGATTAICFTPAADPDTSADAIVEHINQVLINRGSMYSFGGCSSQVACTTPAVAWHAEC